MLSVLLTTAAKARRWGTLFPAAERPGLFALCRALLAGQCANALLPARVGDIARVYLVGRGRTDSGAVALGTVAAEKALDLFFLLVASAIAAAFVSLPPWAEIPLAGVAATGLLFLVLAFLWPERQFLSWLNRLAGRVPLGLGGWLTGPVARCLEGLKALRQPHMLLVAVLWSVVIWALAAATNHLLFLAFDLPLSLGAAIVLLVVLQVGVVPPSTPAKLGIFHSLAMLGLESFGIDRADSLAYALVLHLIVYMPQIVLGAVSVATSLPLHWLGGE